MDTIIFQPKYIPPKLAERADWDYTTGYAVILNGETLYGALQREHLEECL